MVKIKSMCLTNWALRHEDVKESEGVDPRFIDLGTSLSLVVIFTPRPPYRK
jgi:hypothetical protein